MTSSDDQRAGAHRAPRIVDVARLANVSKATAARALNGSDLVTDATRLRVEASAKSLNYRANGLARAMSAGRSRTIGLVIADISNSFFDRATRAIIDTAAAHAYQVLVINTDDDLEAEREAVRVLSEKRVDGIIVVPSSPDAYDHLLVGDRPVAPLVLLDRRIPSMPVGTVTTDDFQSALEAVRLFASRGHARIGILVNSADGRHVTSEGPNGAVSTIFNRVSGFTSGLREFGLSLDPAWIRYARHDHDEATRTAMGMLSLSPRPTAILTTNADAALAVIDACNELRLDIGTDVSLISFDDAPWARVFRPAISVIERPVYELGEAAVRALIAQIETGDTQAVSREMKNRVIDRDSVSCIGAPVPRIDDGEAAGREGVIPRD